MTPRKVIVGIGVFAFITGAVAERFMSVRIEQAERDIEEEFQEAETEIEAELTALRERLDRLGVLLARRSG